MKFTILKYNQRTANIWEYKVGINANVINSVRL